MLNFILPAAIVGCLFWVYWSLRGVWHAIPRSNADFDLAGPVGHSAGTRSAGANPAGAWC